MIVNLTHVNWRTSLLVWFVLIIGTVVASDTTWAQEEVSENPAEQVEVVEVVEVEPEISAVDLFMPDFDDQDLIETGKRAWEYRPYQVAVWFCLDGSPLIDAIYNNIRW